MVKISKTYVPKEKEKYMCAKHLVFFKQNLVENPRLCFSFRIRIEQKVLKKILFR